MKKTITSDIEIFQFDGLPELLGSENFSKYLVVVYKKKMHLNGKDVRLWYPIHNEILNDNYIQYFSKSFGFSKAESTDVLKYYNNVVEKKLYKKLSLKKITRKSPLFFDSDCARTKEGILLVNCSTDLGKIWYSKKDMEVLTE